MGEVRVRVRVGVRVRVRVRVGLKCACRLSVARAQLEPLSMGHPHAAGCSVGYGEGWVLSAGDVTPHIHLVRVRVGIGRRGEGWG